MKTYSYEGKEYVESGEVRLPRRGDVYVEHLGHANRASIDFSGTRCKILIPKEQKVSEVQDEYQIPVLVKAIPRVGVKAWATLKLVRDCGEMYEVKPDGSGIRATLSKDVVIPYPTQAQVEAEQAKLAPKPDTLPAPVRQALQAADLGCRREGVEKLIEAIYLNPPKVSP